MYVLWKETNEENIMYSACLHRDPVLVRRLAFSPNASFKRINGADCGSKSGIQG
jgi:hypothetical protein